MTNHEALTILHENGIEAHISRTRGGVTIRGDVGGDDIAIERPNLDDAFDAFGKLAYVAHEEATMAGLMGADDKGNDDF